VSFDLWIEGYSVSGCRSKASLLGSYDANDIHDAVAQWREEICYVSNMWNGSFYEFWGCRIFDNEVEARKSFG